MNSPTRIPYEVHWFLCSENEPPHEKNYHPSRSEQLLLTDGKQIFAGCFQIYDEDGVLEGPPEWIQHGRDGYQLDGITHWAFQPNLPEKTDG